MSKSKRRAGRRRGELSPVSAIAAGLASAIISAFALIVLLALAAYATPDPDRLVLPAAMTALYLSSFIGGIVTSLLMGGDAPCGLICGIAYFTALLLMSFFLPSGTATRTGMGVSILLHTAAPLFSLLGALCASSLLRRRSRRRRRR